MLVRFELEIIEDVQQIRGGRKFLSELSDDICAAVGAHPKVQGNAVNCTKIQVMESPLRQ